MCWWPSVFVCPNPSAGLLHGCGDGRPSGSNPMSPSGLISSPLRPAATYSTAEGCYFRFSSVSCSAMKARTSSAIPRTVSHSSA